MKNVAKLQYGFDLICLKIEEIVLTSVLKKLLSETIVTDYEVESYKISCRIIMLSDLFDIHGYRVSYFYGLNKLDIENQQL